MSNQLKKAAFFSVLIDFVKYIENQCNKIKVILFFTYLQSYQTVPLG